VKDAPLMPFAAIAQPEDDIRAAGGAACGWGTAAYGIGHSTQAQHRCQAWRRCALAAG
jgi:hypothetical protein